MLSENCVIFYVKHSRLLHRIMGETGNVLYELAQSNSVLQEKIESYTETFVKSNGEAIPTEKMTSYYEVFEEVLKKSHDNNQLLSDIFKNHLENELVPLEADDKQIVMQYFKNLVETLTPAVNWDHETGAGLSSFEMLPGSTAMSLKTGFNAFLYMIMVRAFNQRYQRYRYQPIPNLCFW